MSVEHDSTGIFEARDQLHQYYRAPTMLDNADLDDAEFFLDIMSDVNEYISEAGILQEQTYAAASGRSAAKYSLEQVEDMIDAERARADSTHVDPLLSALDKLNRYRGRNESPVSVPDETVVEPIDSSYLISG